MVLTPVPNTSRLLTPRVKHGADNQKARRNGPFAYPEDETTNKETRKILAGRMAT